MRDTVIMFQFCVLDFLKKNLRNSGCFLKAFADIASENDSDLDTYLTLLQVDVLRVHAS